MPCPRCGRAVALARRQCLYCGADVGSSTEAPAAVAPPVAPAAPATDRVLLVIALDGADPATVAAALGLSLYEGRQWVLRGGHHLLRSLPPSEAAAERGRLEAAGIAVFTVEEAAARAAAEPQVVEGGRLEGNGLALRTAAGSVTVGAPDLLLVVKGAIVRELPPMESRKWSRTATLEPGFRFHLHRRAADRPLEIDPDAFDFGARHEGAGARRGGLSSLLEIAGWIAAAAAGVAVDDGFRRIAPALSPAPPASGPAARLEDALRSGPRAAAILDNLAQFRFYSAWRAAVERGVRAR